MVKSVPEFNPDDPSESKSLGGNNFDLTDGHTKLQDYVNKLRASQSFEGGNQSTEQALGVDQELGRQITFPPIEGYTYQDLIPVPISAMDAGTSVQELIGLGLLKQADDPLQQSPGWGGDAVDNAWLMDASVRHEPIDLITVAYVDQTRSAFDQVNPDFRVEMDGTVEVLSNPELNNKHELVVEVKLDPEQFGMPTDAQQRSLDGLQGYLTKRLMDGQNPSGTNNGGTEDRLGSVTDQVMQSINITAPEMNLPEPTRWQVENMQSFLHGCNGVLSPERVDSYFPPRDVPRAPDESNQVFALKDMVAGFASVGEKHPYRAVRDTGGGVIGVARYLLTVKLIDDWLKDLGLDDPITPSQIEHLEKTNHKLATSLKSAGFEHLLEMLRKGEHPTAHELKAGLPKKLQEQIAEHEINKFAQASMDKNRHVDVSKVALSMRLGHLPTEADLKRADNQLVMSSASCLHGLSCARMENPGQPIEWTNTNHKLYTLAEQAKGENLWGQSGYSAALLEYGNEGCMASESVIFKRAGIPIQSANVREGVSQALKQGAQWVDAAQAQPGDLVIFGNQQHIGIYTGKSQDGRPMACSNSSSKGVWLERSISASGYSHYKFLRLPSNTDNIATT